MRNKHDAVARRYAWFLVAVALLCSSRFTMRPAVDGAEEGSAMAMNITESN